MHFTLFYNIILRNAIYFMMLFLHWKILKIFRESFGFYGIWSRDQPDLYLGLYEIWSRDQPDLYLHTHPKMVSYLLIKEALGEFSSLFFSSPKLTYMKDKQWGIFRLECNI